MKQEINENLYDKKEIINEYWIGIDESGRSPVFGPLVYCGFFCNKNKCEEYLKGLGVKDSKKVSEKKRREIQQRLVNENEMGWIVEIISPREISESMFKREKINLNQVSYNAVSRILKKIISLQKNKPERIIVDALGPKEEYIGFIQSIVKGVSIVVEVSADSLFPIVGAASILAKNICDDETKALKQVYQNKELNSFKEMGSGTWGDKKTCDWIMSHCDSIFGYPVDFVRLSWEPVIKAMDRFCFPVEWFDDSTEKSFLTQEKILKRKKAMIKKKKEREILIRKQHGGGLFFSKNDLYKKDKRKL